jgi:hypothetical protein
MSEFEFLNPVLFNVYAAQYQPYRTDTILSIMLKFIYLIP